MGKKFYKAIMICISLMLIVSMTFVFTGCSKNSGESSEPTVTLHIMVEWKDATGKTTTREFLTRQLQILVKTLSLP